MLSSVLCLKSKSFTQYLVECMWTILPLSIIFRKKWKIVKAESNFTISMLSFLSSPSTHSSKRTLFVYDYDIASTFNEMYHNYTEVQFPLGYNFPFNVTWNLLWLFSSDGLLFDLTKSSGEQICQQRERPILFTGFRGFQ